MIGLLFACASSFLDKMHRGSLPDHVILGYKGISNSVLVDLM